MVGWYLGGSDADAEDEEGMMDPEIEMVSFGRVLPPSSPSRALSSSSFPFFPLTISSFFGFDWIMGSCRKDSVQSSPNSAAPFRMRNPRDALDLEEEVVAEMVDLRLGCLLVRYERVSFFRVLSFVLGKLPFLCFCGQWEEEGNGVDERGARVRS